MENKPKTSIKLAYMLMPLFTSLISITHVVTFLSVSNPSIMAVLLSIAYEIGMLVALMSMFFIHRLEKATVYFIFCLLFLMQLIGNIFYSFNYITECLQTNNNYLNTVIEFINQICYLFGYKPSTTNIKMIIAIIVGSVIPIVSMSFLRLLTKYVKSFEIKEEKPKEEESNDIPKEDTSIQSTFDKWLSLISDIKSRKKKTEDSNISKEPINLEPTIIDSEIYKSNQKSTEEIISKEPSKSDNTEMDSVSEVVELPDPTSENKLDKEVINIAQEKSQIVVDDSLQMINNKSSTTHFHPLR